jgi:tetratricopeptide (TPR) repeat protein
MDPLDDLPKRHDNHATESKAEAAFQSLVSTSDDFVLQGADRQDYGTDYQIEVVDQARATNVRLHVQLKGTQKAPNADGSISIEIARTNLNYLLMQPRSLFVCYHVPTDSLRFCTADTVVRQYEHSGQRWIEQQTLTVRFSEILTAERLKSLARLARFGAASSRNIRVAQTAARPEAVPGIVKTSLPELPHVPDDDAQAVAVLVSLYESGKDTWISAAFDKFAAVLGRDHEAMTYCYMAEINLGMAGRSTDPRRIADGIAHCVSQLGKGKVTRASLYYSIGNGHAALDRHTEAVEAFETALSYLTSEDADDFLLAQCHKNLGTSHERLGDGEKAAVHYREALRYNPELPEAHCALGFHHHRKGAFAEALGHFDQVVFGGRTLGKQSSVAGGQINTLFNLGDGRAAFREITSLLAEAENEEWIWPWCARLVARFGRANVENARLSLNFWHHYLKIHPGSPDGLREKLLNKLYLRSEGSELGLTYAAFKVEFEAGIEHVEGEALPHLWDRLGHWAQDDGDWVEAERCFRAAYELAGGHYGYCLGTALNVLERYEESLPILLEQATKVQPDAMSWFQVAVACEKTGRTQQSIESYRKAIALDSDYDLAWFNLGGVYWNAGEWSEAAEVWKTATAKFPDHELTTLLRQDLPFVLR